MGATMDAGSERGGRARNVELNVVPFIDLMSCLTAFLLVTAVWSNLAQIPAQPKAGVHDPLDENPPPTISVLVTASDYWLGTSGGDMHRLGALAELDDALRGYSETTANIELAAEDEVTYDVLIAAMDTVIASGFDGVQVVDPPSLSVRFHR
jgi:biopolymer transport protein ExbD